MAQGRMYTGEFADVATATATHDWFELIAATSGVTVLHGVYLAQDSLIGDANETFAQVAIFTGATTTGSGGDQTAAEVPLSLGDAAATAVLETNNTTVAGTGTIVQKHSDAFNLRVGWQYLPPPEQRISWSANILQVQLLVTITSAQMMGTIIWEELN